MIHYLNLIAAAEDYAEINTSYGPRLASKRIFVLGPNSTRPGAQVKLVATRYAATPLECFLTNPFEIPINFCDDTSSTHVLLDALDYLP